MNRIILICLFLFFTSCNFYKPGNIGFICIVETDMNLELVSTLSDSLIKSGCFVIPKERHELSSIVNSGGHDHMRYKIFYVNGLNEELFMVTMQSEILIRYYGKYINNEFHLYDQTALESGEIKEAEIQESFKKNVLLKIKRKAYEMKLPDSIIYNF